MHPALECEDVLEHILGFLHNKSLASVARTCRGFFGPTVSKLWEDVRVPAVVALAEIVLKSHVVTQTAPHCLSMAARWQSFEKYARAVKRLYISDEYMEGHALRQHEMLRTLGLICPSLPLLPCLRSLVYHTNNLETLDNVLLFLGPTLQKLVIVDKGAWRVLESERWVGPVVRQGEIALGSILYFILLRAPNLVDLHLDILLLHDTIHADALVNLVRGLRYLKVFRADAAAIEHRALRALADLPFLEELKIGMEHGAYLIKYRPTILDFREGNFKSLQVLHIICGYQGTVELLKTAFLRLERLYATIDVETFLSEDYVKQLCFRIGVNCQKLAILTLHLRESTRTKPIFWHPFRDVVGCSELKRVLVSLRGPLVIRDTDMTELAQSWPSLESLSIEWKDDYFVRGTSSAELTVPGLQSLAMYCPHLRSLALSRIDARSIPTRPQTQSRSKKVHFEFGALQAVDEKEASLFIRLIWPNATIGWVRRSSA